MERILVAIMCLAVMPRVSVAADKPVVLSHHPQLFLDDHVVAGMTGLKRKLLQPARHPANPLIVQEHPWESRCLISETVLFDTKLNRFRLWYCCSEDADAKPEYYTGYAESTDGVRWSKPMVGSGPWGRHRRHNIVGTAGSMAWPPMTDDPARRYKAVSNPFLAFSGDGIRWFAPPAAVKNWRRAVRKNDTMTSIVWWRGKWMAYVRNQEKDSRPVSNLQRAVAVTVSKDFIHWTPKKTIWMTDKRDGHPWTQPYGLAATVYGDVLVGLVPLLTLDRTRGNNSLGDVGAQLLVSRDGYKWKRVADRAWFMPQGPRKPVAERAWDMRVWPSSRILIKDDVMHFYYTGYNMRHSERLLTRTPHAVGLATLHADRFVALIPVGGAEGVLQTRPFLSPPGDLLVNAELKGPGDLGVELLDASGAVVGGFDRVRCRLTPADKLRYRVRWEQPVGPARTWSDVPAKAPCALRFTLRRGRLFAFQIAPASLARPYGCPEPGSPSRRGRDRGGWRRCRA